MNIPYELWPIWADYLEEQGQETELLRYYLTYIHQSISSFYIPNLECSCGLYYELGTSDHIILIYGYSYGYCGWSSLLGEEYGNCYRASFFGNYYGCGGRDFLINNDRTGNGQLSND